MIIEVKRDNSGSNVDIQALKYASYCARLSPQDILNVYTDYLKTHDQDKNAKDSLLEFLEAEDEEELNSRLSAM